MSIIRKMERQFLQEHVVTEQGGMTFFPNSLPHPTVGGVSEQLCGA